MLKKITFLFLIVSIALSACGTLEVSIDQTPTPAVDANFVATMVAATLAAIPSTTPLPTDSQFQVTHPANVRYAKPAVSGSGDCSSWANACTLQTALINAVSGNEIWVAAGTHKSTTGTDRNATFQLKTGVSIYGGFSGTETERNQRDFTIDRTILSGDLNGDDIGPQITLKIPIMLLLGQPVRLWMGSLSQMGMQMIFRPTTAVVGCTTSPAVRP